MGTNKNKKLNRKQNEQINLCSGCRLWCIEGKSSSLPTPP